MSQDRKPQYLLPTPAARSLRESLSSEGISVVPGVTDPFTAKLAEKVGFPVLFATGAGIANASYGLPDIGFLGAMEMAEAVGRICQSVSVPVIADGDTGYGNALSTARTVSMFERAGVAGVMLEDQVTPKKCGHFQDKSIISLDEMLEKIRAFQVARHDPDLVLMARTDAISVAGINEAIARGKAFAEAGADLVFVEAPRNTKELKRIAQEIPSITVANMVEGGVTPQHTAAELEAMGFGVVLFANMALRIAGQAVLEGFIQLRDEGSSKNAMTRMMSWEDRQGLVGFPDWQAFERQVQSPDSTGHTISNAEARDDD